jgi:hypothetical protein
VGDDVTVNVGRTIRDVAYSLDTNTTTFQYAARFSFQYQVNPNLFGLPIFPLDQHSFRLRLTSDFDANIDEHTRTAIMPTSNYQGQYQMTLQSGQEAEYDYAVVILISHPDSFRYLMLFWTWGIVILLFVMTTAIGVRLSRPEPRIDSIVTAISGLLVFVPVYELSLQTFKAPLTITLSDGFLFLALVANVALLIMALWNRQQKSELGAVIPR